MEKSELEALCRRLIEGGDEYTTVEFKSELNISTEDEKIKFCKTISAISNAYVSRDGKPGYLIIGAKPKELLGGVKEFSNHETTASIHEKTDAYLEPNPTYQIHTFRDEKKGLWGVIEIPDDPQHRPVTFKKSFKQHEINKGDGFIRDGPRIRLLTAREAGEIVERKHRLKRPKLRVLFKNTETENGIMPGKATTVRPELIEFIKKKRPKEPEIKFTSSPLATMLEARDSISDITAAMLKTQDIASEFNTMSRSLSMFNGKTERQYEEEMDGYMRLLRQSPPVSMILENAGNMPATDIDLELNFPMEVDVVTEDNLPQKPSEPGTSFLLPRPPAVYHGPREVEGPDDEIDERGRVITYRIRHLKHRNIFPFTIGISNASKEGEYNIKYYIHSAEDDEPTIGHLKLTVKIEKKKEIIWNSEEDS